MILTDLEIQKLLDDGLISIEPNPPNEAYDSTAVNLTLDFASSNISNEGAGIHL